MSESARISSSISAGQVAKNPVPALSYSRDQMLELIRQIQRLQEHPTEGYEIRPYIEGAQTAVAPAPIQNAVKVELPGQQTISAVGPARKQGVQVRDLLSFCQFIVMAAREGVQLDPELVKAASKSIEELRMAA